MRRNSISAILSLTDASSKDLQPMSRIRPVAALPFAARYRAIDFSLSSFTHAEIESVALFIGGSGRSIYDHIRSGSAWDLESRLRGGIFTFSQTYLKQRLGDESFSEDDFYANHREFLEKSRTEYVVVGGGKVVAKIDILNLRDYHAGHDGDMTIVYKRIPADEVVGRPYEKVLKMDKDGDLITLVPSEELEDRAEPYAQSLNFYFLSVSKMLELLERATREGIQMDIDRLLAYYSQFYDVKGYDYTGPSVNIDSVKAYYDGNMSLLEKGMYDQVFHEGNEVITKGKNEPPTYYSNRAEVTKSLFASGCFVDGTVENSLVFRRVKIGKDAKIVDSIVMQGSKIGDGAVLEYCILDKNVIVEPGAVIKGTQDNPVVIEKNATVTATRGVQA